MDRKKALEIIQHEMDGPRFQHTLGVLETAEKLAIHYKANIEKAVIAAIFHDFAKLKPVNELKKIIIQEEMDQRLLQFHPELWHGPAAVYYLRNVASINDIDILNAIRYHTTGRANMSLLEKIIYLADYIEPGRNFPGVQEVRDLAYKNLNHALFTAIKNTIQFLINKRQLIFPDTLDAYNDLIKLLEE